MEGGASFSFELTGKRGAALVTRHKTYNEDALMKGAFEQYTKKHYESWVSFSRDKQYGDDVKPVLVTGVDITKDFAMVAYSDEGTSTSLEGDLANISVPMFGSNWGTWRASGLTVHRNFGPQQRLPPSLAQAMGSPSRSRTSRTNSDDDIQCVFVRYCTMRMRMGFIPKVMRAAAGPHDLGSGQNHDSTFPELTARSDRASEVERDSDTIVSWMQYGPDFWDDDPAPNRDVVIHNTPNVRYYLWPLFFL